MTNNKLLTPQEIEKCLNDSQVRKEVAKQSSLWFGSIYFGHYFDYDFANFHYDLFNLCDDEKIKMSVVTMFRGSGKSTIMTTLFPLYAVFGKPQKKLIVIISQTADLAQAHLKNIKLELENNQLLKDDLGPFKEVSSLWNSQALEFQRSGAMITAISIDQRIRGFRRGKHRPDLIICDDIEDSNSVRTEEGRKKTQEIYSGEIAPLGDKNTQIFMIGNYLHPASLLAHLTNQIKLKKITGKSLFVPLMEKGEIAWPAKFPTLQDVEAERNKIADDIIWNREYLLKIVNPDNLYYNHSVFQYYDQLPSYLEPYYQYTMVAIDPAVTTNETSDYTAILFANVYDVEGKLLIYFLPIVYNQRFESYELVEKILEIHNEDPSLQFVYEDNGFQTLIGDMVRSQNESVNIVGVKTGKWSKLDRLNQTVNWHKKGQIYVPRTGFEPVINQICGIDKEHHDDLIDAFSLLINSVFNVAKNPDLNFTNSVVMMEVDRDDIYRTGLESLDSEGMSVVDAIYENVYG